MRAWKEVSNEYAQLVVALKNHNKCMNELNNKTIDQIKVNTIKEIENLTILSEKADDIVKRMQEMTCCIIDDAAIVTRLADRAELLLEYKDQKQFESKVKILARDVLLVVNESKKTTHTDTALIMCGKIATKMSTRAHVKALSKALRLSTIIFDEEIGEAADSTYCNVEIVRKLCNAKMRLRNLFRLEYYSLIMGTSVESGVTAAKITNTLLAIHKEVSLCSDLF